MHVFNLMMRALALAGAVVLGALIAAVPATAASLIYDDRGVVESSTSTIEFHLYGGGAIGGGWLNTVTGVTPAAPIDWSGSGSGVIAGAFVGADVDFGGLFFGAEAEALWSNMTATSAFSMAPATLTQTVSIDAIYALNARFGVEPTKGFRLYGKGGLAIASLSDTSAITGLGPPMTLTSGTSNPTGWTAAAGVELDLTPNIGVRAELAYYDFGTVTTLVTGVPAPPGAATNTAINTTVAKVGIFGRL